MENENGVASFAGSLNTTDLSVMSLVSGLGYTGPLFSSQPFNKLKMAAINRKPKDLLNAVDWKHL
ncbi:MAG: hypothetical protein K2P74_04915 [Nitrosomonas sp.]|nr:hypothetical protein [Nitrosomonas sp.]